MKPRLQNRTVFLSVQYFLGTLHTTHTGDDLGRFYILILINFLELKSIETECNEVFVLGPEEKQSLPLIILASDKNNLFMSNLISGIGYN